MKLVALCGIHGAGKDTVADALPARKLAFADKLYEEVAEAWAEDIEWLRNRKYKDAAQWEMRLDACRNEEFLGYLRWSGKAWIGSYDDGSLPRSPRQILQWWGDYRRAQDPDYFVKAARARMVWGEPHVFTDVRFANEAALVRQLGGQIWQIKRPGHNPPCSGHTSETTGDEFNPNVILLNNGTLQDLQNAALEEWNK